MFDIDRYSYNGKPLYARDSYSHSTLPRCSCGSARVFEMQLMPGLVNYLRQSSDSGDSLFVMHTKISKAANLVKNFTRRFTD
jgi:Programmed cell death protein 2, C-terminal putative domain